MFLNLTPERGEREHGEKNKGAGPLNPLRVTSAVEGGVYNNCLCVGGGGGGMQLQWLPAPLSAPLSSEAVIHDWSIDPRYVENRVQFLPALASASCSSNRCEAAFQGTGCGRWVAAMVLRAEIKQS